MSDQPHNTTSPVGIANMLAIADLPRLKRGVQAYYEGSIDKLGGNADWDWWLYEDPKRPGEWVIFDVDGPGCVYNFVQHRYTTTEQPTFRFYFDDEPEPRFEITPEQFGGKVPFLEPLAGYFLGDDAPPRGRGPIRVVRSFVPMPHRKSCRITSSVKLVGNDRTKGEGGWGHVTYHAYDSADGVETFNPTDEQFDRLLDQYGQVADLPLPRSAELDVVVKAGESVTLTDSRSEGTVVAISLRLLPFDAQLLSDLWIVMTWDGHARPDVEAPLGAFFGNEYSLRKVGLHLYGQTPDGRLFCKFQMPFWESARIEIHNRGAVDARLLHAIFLHHQPCYPRGTAGYFRSTAYYPPTPTTLGRDSTIGRATGRGHIVAATLTGRSIGNSKYVSCEGDVRLYVDGNRTPRIESDGSESYVGYGWGFVSPGQQNPISGYDGSGEPTCEFSETRSHPGDWIPFQTGFVFNLESGEKNDYPMRHSGLVLYYGLDDVGMTLTDSLDIGDEQSERSHDYRVDGQAWSGEIESAYEGSDDKTIVRDRGRTFTGGCEFVVKIDPRNDGVRLRRRCDQTLGRQRARVSVDGRPIDRTWYVADRNPHYRWLDSEFDLPPRLTAGKASVRITIERVREHPDGTKTPPWSDFRYDVFSLKGQA